MKNWLTWAPLAIICAIAGGINPQITLAKTYASYSNPPRMVLQEGKSAEQPPTEPADSITLDWALEAATSRHPSLAATWYEIKARQGAEQQAGLPPNPAFFGEIEEFGGSGDYSGTGALSSRIGISQELPLGGKISRRVREAKVATGIADLEHRAKIMKIRALVEERFFAVFTLQERLRLQTEQYDFILRTHEVVAKRVKAGDTSPLDLSRSQIELASARIGIHQTRQELETTRYELAASWGAGSPGFSLVAAQYQLDQKFTEQQLQETLKRSPAWRLQEEKLAHANAVLDLTEAQRIPDVELEGGMQRFNESDDHAFFLGITIPLPLFDRNQGAIAEARAMKLKAQYEKEGEFQVLEFELQKAWHKRVSTLQAVQSFETEVLPAAQHAYDAISKAYKSGEIDIIGLFDAQRTWVETRMRRLDLLQDLENSRIEIKRLVGDEEEFSAASTTETSQ